MVSKGPPVHSSTLTRKQDRKEEYHMMIFLGVVILSGVLAWVFLGPAGLLLWLLPGVPPPGPFG